MKKTLTILTMSVFFLLAGNVIGEELQITGFFDITGSYDNSADDKTDFAMNQAELDIEKQLSDKADAFVAVAYNSELGVFELACAEVVLNFHQDEYSFITSASITGGQFDVPFGIDYNVYASIDRKLVSPPLVVDYTHGKWNDFGARLNVASKYGNATLFWVNGFESSAEISDAAQALILGVNVGDEINTTPANSFGGRLGITPVENLELGGSMALGLNESNKDEMIMFGGDAQFSHEKFQFKGEYISHSINRSIAEENNQGFYAQALYNFNPVYLAVRYGSFQPDGADWTDRVTGGIGWTVTNGVELRWESTFHKVTDNNTNILQLVAGF
jgi:hypothetical protein